MRNLNYRVCDLYTWQSFFYLDVLRGASVGFTQGLAMLDRDGGQDLETPCIQVLVPHVIDIFSRFMNQSPFRCEMITYRFSNYRYLIFQLYVATMHLECSSCRKIHVLRGSMKLH